MKKILFVGESWQAHVTEAKGYDTFCFNYYEEATSYIEAAIENCWAEFNHIPSHLVEAEFPATLEELQKYDAVMFSDVGANTFNLPMNTFMRLNPTVNKLNLVEEYVKNGGTFVMIGGYLSFQGFEAKGCYKNSVIEKLLPITMLNGDDRVEHPEGVMPSVVNEHHYLCQNLPTVLPQILGYNKLIKKPQCETVIEVEDNPFLAVGAYGQGKAIAFATDCAPHWAPTDFCESKTFYQIWENIITNL